MDQVMTLFKAILLSDLSPEDKKGRIKSLIEIGSSIVRKRMSDIQGMKTTFAQKAAQRDKKQDDDWKQKYVIWCLSKKDVLAACLRAPKDWQNYFEEVWNNAGDEGKERFREIYRLDQP